MPLHLLARVLVARQVLPAVETVQALDRSEHGEEGVDVRGAAAHAVGTAVGDEHQPLRAVEAIVFYHAEVITQRLALTLDEQVARAGRPQACGPLASAAQILDRVAHRALDHVRPYSVDHTAHDDEEGERGGWGLFPTAGFAL